MLRLILYVMLLVIAAPLSVFAGPSCDSRDSIVKSLAENHRETTTAAGITNTGGMIEILTTKDGSTWTMIMSMPNGMTCLLAAGENWRNVERAVVEGPVT